MTGNNSIATRDAARLRTKLFGATAAAVFIASAGLSAAAQETRCFRGAEERNFIILTPGKVGAACDLQVRGDGPVRTPFHANHQADFCATKLVGVIEGLTAEGFDCSGQRAAAPSSAAEAPAVAANDDTTAASTEFVAMETSDAAVDPAVDAQQTAMVDDNEPEEQVTTAADLNRSSLAQIETIAASQTAPAGQPTPETTPSLGEVPTSPAAAPQTPVFQAVTEETEAPATAKVAALEQPPVVAAVETAETATTPYASSYATGGPVDLTQASVPIQRSGAAPVRTASAAGRLVGATPSDPVNPPQPVSGETNVENALMAEGVAAAPRVQIAAAQSAQPPAEQSLTQPPATVASPDPAASGVNAGVGAEGAQAVAYRPAEDIIRGVLQAQAAAWNEGDLSAFMAGYWNSPALRMVSGVNVTTGWKRIMRRYDERYRNATASGEPGTSLGFLTFDDLDVTVVDEDVAVVVGRYRLEEERAAAPLSGTFTLVLKQFSGLWRIVHDHTVSDPKPETETASTDE